MMEFRFLGPEDYFEYDNLVDSSIHGSIFHKSWWLKNLECNKRDSFTLEIIGAYENAGLVGAMPIPIFRKMGMNLIYSPILTPYLGPVFERVDGEKKCTEISRQKEICREFAAILKKNKKCIYYPFSHNIIDLQPFKWVGFNIGIHYSYLLKIANYDQVLNAMDKKRRNDISKGLKEIFSIKYDNIDDLIELTEMTLKRQRQRKLNHRIVNSIFEECKKRSACKVFTIFQGEGQKLASIMLIWDNKRSYYLMGGSSSVSRWGMSLILWEAIKFSHEKLGLHEFDFEGSDVESIESYFRGFGGELTPLFYSYDDSISRMIMIKIYQRVKKLRGLRGLTNR